MEKKIEETKTHVSFTAEARMQHLVSTGHPAVLTYLQNERARLKTYKNWPHKKPAAKCLAHAGFFYFDQGDLVQCVYCQGILSDWQKRDNPMDVHKHHFAHCPFINELPLVNYGTTEYIACCMEHSMSDIPYKRRAPLQHQGKPGMVQYGMNIIMLLMLIGLSPMARAGGAERKLPGVTRLEAWKGIVGIRINEAYMPRGYSEFNWTLNLNACESARTKLSDTISLYREKLDESNIPDRNRPKVNEFLVDALEELTRYNPSEDWEGLTTIEVVNDTLPTTECMKEPHGLLGPEVCEDIEREATILHDNAVSALAKVEATPGFVADIAHLVQKYANARQQFSLAMKKLRDGEVPENLNRLFKSTCHETCDRRTQTRVGRDTQTSIVNLADFARVHGMQLISKAKDAAVKWVRTHFTLPCINRESILAKYKWLALPFLEDNKAQQLYLPPEMNQWVDPQQQKFLETKPLCSKKENLCVVPKGNSQAVSAYLKGTVNQPVISTPVNKNPSRFMFEQISPASAIVSTIKPVTVYSDCNKVRIRDMLQGIYAIDAPPGCQISIPEHKIVLEGNDAIKQSQGNDHQAPKIVALKPGEFAQRDFEWKDFFKYSQQASYWYQEIITHMMNHANYYLIGTLAFLCFITCSAAMLLWPKFVQLRNHTHVYVRRPVQPA
jgi:hypothetical protein